MTPNSVSNSIEDEEKALVLQAELCQSLTHPFRLKILQILKDGEKNVSDIQFVTKKPQPFISQHLRVLKDKGVVTCERKANEVYYQLVDPKILEMCKIAEELVIRRKTSKIE